MHRGRFFWLTVVRQRCLGKALHADSMRWEINPENDNQILILMKLHKKQEFEQITSLGAEYDDPVQPQSIILL